VRAALEELANEKDALRVATLLKARLRPELALRAAELCSLKTRSRRSYQEGFLPYLTRKGLEQATPQVVAMRRARKLQMASGTYPIWDATCGIGADSVALARLGQIPVSSDADAEHARFAQANLHAQGVEPRVIVARAESLPLREIGALVVDPDRRVRGKRSLEVDEWSPTLAECVALARRASGACIKLAPAIAPSLVEALLGREADLRYSMEWVSLDGELREVALWTGVFASEEARNATWLGSGGEEGSLSGIPLEVEAWSPPEAREVRWLADPDPSIVRAGLLGLAAQEAGLRPLAPRLGYLGGREAPPEGPWRAWQVLDCAPLDTRRVRAMLREHDIGSLQVRKRGHPDRAEVLERRLRGKGRRRGHLAVARLEDGHAAYLLGPGSEPGATEPPEA